MTSPQSAPVPQLLNRTLIRSLLTLPEVIASVSDAFAAHARGATLKPALTHVDAAEGEFHLKAGGLTRGARTYFAVKANGGFFGNRAKYGLPAIQGIIYLADAANGCPLAVLDSGEITIQRTAAATAVAVKHLARPGPGVVTICGAGGQGRFQLRAIAQVYQIRKAFVWTRDAVKMAAQAREWSRELGLEVLSAPSLAGALAESDVVVTCTPARQPYIQADWVKPGTFVAAIGSDSPDKQELDARLLAQNAVVCDLTAQCAEVGELHAALRAGLMATSDVRAELGQVIAGLRPGRISSEEIVIFDSTGTALQDVALAAAAYEAALALNKGQPFVFAG